MLPGAPAAFPSASIIRSVNKAQEENASAILTRALDMCTQRNKVRSNKNIYNRRRDPKEMICDVAEQMQVDLIVIGSRGLGKIKRYGRICFINYKCYMCRALIESVSNYVIHHAKCPVLVIKAPTNTQMTLNA
uniref:Universal stress protein 20 n=1 Tax=Salvia miltiorrhiza TaxID=226208 RepID=A0A290YXS8_SALMI|nr:universal stress protein 20 [Salvia miltiorrhiza]